MSDIRGSSENPPFLLAVDAGLRAGMALFANDGKLLRCYSRHFRNRTVLRAGAAGILGETPGIAWLVVEGGGPPADIWFRAAESRGIGVIPVTAETWREELLYPRERRTGRGAKRHAEPLARAVVEWSGIRRPTSLRHDAVEAILVGVWGMVRVAGPECLPPALAR